jgi:hypothetical protein
VDQVVVVAAVAIPVVQAAGVVAVAIRVVRAVAAVAVEIPRVPVDRVGVAAEIILHQCLLRRNPLHQRTSR